MTRRKENLFNYAILLAAGEGQRFKELTIDLPKALIDIDGTPLLLYSLNQIQQKVSHILITVGHQKSKMIRYFSGKHQIIDTSNKGNSWWIFNSALRYVNEPVLVLACDIIARLDIPFIYSNYVKIGSPPCMMVPVRSVEGIDGDYIEEKDKRVLSLSHTKRTQIYGSGIQVINPFMINENLKEYDDFNQLWLALIRKRMLYISDLYPYTWFSINTKEHLAKYLSFKGHAYF